MKRKIISISGNIAVGKSEVARILSEKLNMELYKASSRFREEARRLNMDIVEFNDYIKSKPELDYAIEQKTKNIIDAKENLVVDARLGFYIAKDSFKVCIVASKEVAAKRLYEAAKSRGNEEEYPNFEDAYKGIVKREEYEEERWLNLYGVNVHDVNNYDIVIDSTNISAEEVADIIIQKYNEWLKKD